MLGGFVSGDPYSLVQLHWLERARLAVMPPPEDPKTWLGVDVAYRGDDDSVIVVRRGPVVLHCEERHGHDTVQVAGWAADLARRYGATDINVDAIGVGAGVAPVLRQQTSAKVHEIMAGAPARDSERFANLRAEMSWGLRERFESGEISLANLPRDVVDRLSGELTGIRWFQTPSGKVQIEPKEKFKQRLGRSPDAADALILAFAVPKGAGLAVSFPGHGRGVDPFFE